MGTVLPEMLIIVVVCLLYLKTALQDTKSLAHIFFSWEA